MAGAVVGAAVDVVASLLSSRRTGHTASPFLASRLLLSSSNCPIYGIGVHCPRFWRGGGRLLIGWQVSKA